MSSRVLPHRSAEELQASLDHIRSAPVGAGTLEMIVARPATGERQVLTEGELDLAVGLVGDTWNQRSSKRSLDGGPHPDMQLNVMSWRAVQALADTEEHRALAGDQLYLDLSLRDVDLPPGSLISIGAERGGQAVIMVTDQPHTGCAQFVERFGEAGTRWANGRTGKELHLRGINARVHTPGQIRVGDQVRVEPGR